MYAIPATNFRSSMLWLPALVATLVLFGGSAQVGPMADIPLQIGVVTVGAIWWARGRFSGLKWSKLEIAILALLIGWPILQQLPLPPSLWTQLGGRALYVEAYRAVGEPLPSLPISVWPGLTRNATLFLVVPVTCFLIAKAANGNERTWLIGSFVAAGLLSVVVGLAQIAEGADSNLRLYTVRNDQGAIGFFANRNHFGVMLAALIPCCAWFTVFREDNPDKPLYYGLAAAAGAALLAGAALTGSRAAVILALAGTIAATILFSGRGKEGRALWSPRIALIIAGVAIVGLIATSTALSSRFERLTEGDPRVNIIPQLTQLTLQSLPTGTGFGSFAAVFPQMETIDTLAPSYWNHAHNDYFQIAIEGGIPALITLLMFALWWFRASWAALFQSSHAKVGNASLARLAVIVIGILLIHSIADYPLRTGTMAGMFGIMCGVLANPNPKRKRRRSERPTSLGDADQA